MKKLVVILCVASMAFVFGSCANESKECTCYYWQDGKNEDKDPAIFDNDDMKELGEKTCKGLQDSFGPKAYDEATKSGYICQ